MTMTPEQALAVLTDMATKWGESAQWCLKQGDLIGAQEQDAEAERCREARDTLAAMVPQWIPVSGRSPGEGNDPILACWHSWARPECGHYAVITNRDYVRKNPHFFTFWQSLNLPPDPQP